MTWQDLLMIAGAIGTIVAGVKGVQYLFSLTPTHKIQTTMDRHSAELKDHDEHLKRIDRKLDDTDEKLDKITSSLNALGIAIATLINHEIDGNDTKKLTEVRDELFKQFIER